jgi:hypothetical protein
MLVRVEVLPRRLREEGATEDGNVISRHGRNYGGGGSTVKQKSGIVLSVCNGRGIVDRRSEIRRGPATLSAKKVVPPTLSKILLLSKKINQNWQKKNFLQRHLKVPK